VNNKDKLLKTLGGLDHYLNYYGEVVTNSERIKDNAVKHQYADAATAATAVLVATKALMTVLENYRAIALKQLTGQDPVRIPVNQPSKPKLTLIKGGAK
jgi:hypothetical protein